MLGPSVRPHQDVVDVDGGSRHQWPVLVAELAPGIDVQSVGASVNEDLVGFLGRLLQVLRQLLTVRSADDFGDLLYHLPLEPEPLEGIAIRQSLVVRLHLTDVAEEVVVGVHPRRLHQRSERLLGDWRPLLHPDVPAEPCQQIWLDCLRQGVAGRGDFVDRQVGPEADRSFRETCLAEVERVDVVAGFEGPVPDRNDESHELPEVKLC